MKYYLVQKEEDGSLFRTTCDSLHDAQKVLQDHLKWEREDGGRVEKCDTNHYCVYDGKSLTITEYYIEKGDKSTKSNNQQLTLSFNTKNKTTMAKQIQIGTRLDGSPVMSNAVTPSIYKPNGTKNKKPAMVVPVQYVTLPQGFYTHAVKYLQTGIYNGKRQFNTYVIGCAFTKNNKKLYVVAQLTYMGGKPAVAVNHYRGYSKRTAWIVFHSLPYHEVKYTQASGKSVSYQSDGTYHAVINDNIRRRQDFNANRQQDNGKTFRSSADGASFSRR